MVINGALTPLSSVRHIWRKQPPDQLGSPPQARLLSGAQRRGEFDFDLLQHPRQRPASGMRGRSR
jgi:hypothetical protein